MIQWKVDNLIKLPIVFPARAPCFVFLIIIYAQELCNFPMNTLELFKVGALAGNYVDV